MQYRTERKRSAVRGVRTWGELANGSEARIRRTGGRIGDGVGWGLAAFGQEGVEATLGILRRELQMVMRQAGTRTVDQITRAHLVGPRG